MNKYENKLSSAILPDDSVINVLVRERPKTTLTNAAENFNGSNSEKENKCTQNTCLNTQQIHQFKYKSLTVVKFKAKRPDYRLYRRIFCMLRYTGE